MTVKADCPAPAAYEAAATRLGCDVDWIRAFAKVEAGPHGGFLDDGTPVILFEPHIFHRLTDGKHGGAYIAEAHGAKWGILSRPKWERGTYGPVEVQHLRLATAVRLDRDAALRSASWGLFQLLGDNFLTCGHATLQSFINAMYRGADAHLAGFVAFCMARPKLVKALREKDMETAFDVYNGKGWRANQYDVKFAAALSDTVRA